MRTALVLYVDGTALMFFVQYSTVRVLYGVEGVGMGDVQLS